MFAHRKQRTTLLQDAGRAASRLAEETKGLADAARSELGELSREVRDQAGDTATQARKATASRLAGAADAVEPSGRTRRRRLPIVLSALAGAAVAIKVARARKRTDTDEPTPAEDREASEEAPATKRTAAPQAKAATTAKTSTAASSGGNRSTS